MAERSDGTFGTLKEYVAGAIGRSASVDDEVSKNFGRWLNIAIQRIEKMVEMRYCYEEKTFDVAAGVYEVLIPDLITHHQVEVWGQTPRQENAYQLTKKTFKSNQPERNIPFSNRDNELEGDPGSYSYSQSMRLEYNEDVKLTLYPKVTSDGYKLYIRGYFYTNIPVWTNATRHWLIRHEPAVLQYSLAEQAYYYLESNNENASPQHQRFLAEFKSLPKDGLAGIMFNEDKEKEADPINLRIGVPSDTVFDGAGRRVVVRGGNPEIGEINSL